MHSIVDIIDEPPELNNTRGIPTTGKSPIVMPTFMTTCQKTIEVIPMAKTVPNMSFEFLAIFVPHNMSKRYRIKRKAEPIKPHSSAITEKAKSECCSGRKCNLVWVPFKKPFPHKRPDPTAILDWII